MKIATRLRCWWLERHPFEKIAPLNNPTEWDASTPETRAFHAWMKKPLRFVVKRIAVPRTWLDQLDGNPKIVYEFFRDDYLPNERQDWRRAILKPIVEFALCLWNFDNNYGEVFDWFLFSLIKIRSRFVFDANVINPNNWYQDGRGRIAIEQSAPFGILSQTDTEIVTNAPVGGPVIMTVVNGQAVYLRLDLEHATEPTPGTHAYPIVRQSASVLDVSPGIFDTGAAPHA